MVWGGCGVVMGWVFTFRWSLIPPIDGVHDTGAGVGG